MTSKFAMLGRDDDHWRRSIELFYQDLAVWWNFGVSLIIFEWLLSTGYLFVYHSNNISRVYLLGDICISSST